MKDPTDTPTPLPPATLATLDDRVDRSNTDDVWNDGWAAGYQLGHTDGKADVPDIPQTPEQFMAHEDGIRAAKASPDATVLRLGIGMLGHILECMLIEQQQENQNWLYRSQS